MACTCRTGPTLIVALLLLIPAALGAQAGAGAAAGAISASSDCRPAALHHTAAIADGGNHSMSLDQRQCSWSPPIVIGGVKGLSYTATGVDDIQHDRSHDHGYAVGRLENGDSYYLSYDGSATMNGPVPAHLEGRWEFTGGTGTLAGLAGGGSYAARPAADGSMEFRIEGKYALKGPTSK